MREGRNFLLSAPAKVNLHLAVGQMRADGYHPISSIFQKISLKDTILLNVLPDEEAKTYVVGLETYVEAGKSTIDKAIKLWREFTGLKDTILVNVTKKIPVQSGLGGGSSDAASVLSALNLTTEGTSNHLSEEELIKMGMEVGCDVPFFLTKCNAATVFGLGEEVYPLEARDDLQGYIIIAKGEKISTKAAYEALNNRKTIQLLERREFLEEEYKKPFTNWNFRNDFELVNKRPKIEVRPDERLFLTGSGSAWVLLTSRGLRELHLDPSYYTYPIEVTQYGTIAKKGKKRKLAVVESNYHNRSQNPVP